MSYTPPTVSDFKAYFRRDFPYAVPSYGAAGRAVVANGELVSIVLTAGGYLYETEPTVTVTAVNESGEGATATAAIDEATGAVTGFTVTEGGAGYLEVPTITVSGGSGDETDLAKVTDNDISKALYEAQQNFNRCLFGTDASANMAFEYLAAHYLCMDLQAGSEGIWSKYNWLTGGKSVGSVAEQYVVPDRVKNSPALAYYSTTRYGAKYLSIVTPLMIGNVTLVAGTTLP